MNPKHIFYEILTIIRDRRAAQLLFGSLVVSLMQNLNFIFRYTYHQKIFQQSIIWVSLAMLVTGLLMVCNELYQQKRYKLSLAILMCIATTVLPKLWYLVWIFIDDPSLIVDQVGKYVRLAAALFQVGTLVLLIVGGRRYFRFAAFVMAMGYFAVPLITLAVYKLFNNSYYLISFTAVSTQTINELFFWTMILIGTYSADSCQQRSETEESLDS